MRVLSVFLVLVGCSANSGETVPDAPEVLCAVNEPRAVVLLRDPGSGACHGVSVCAPVHPDEAPCGGSCGSLSEQACFATSGCFATYTGTRSSFLGCWGTAPSGPVHDGSCLDLDAHTCSRHDNCATVYRETAGVTQFDHCTDETGGL